MLGSFKIGGKRKRGLLGEGKVVELRHMVQGIEYKFWNKWKVVGIVACVLSIIRPQRSSVFLPELPAVER